MIKVTRLNDTSLWVNPHLIEFAEETPDLVLSLVSGKKIIVKNKMIELNNMIIEYRKQIGLSKHES